MKQKIQALIQSPWFYVALIFGMMVVIDRCWQYDNAQEYARRQYREDVVWCVDRGFNPYSEAIDSPVTCLDKEQQSVAVPPNSVGPVKEL